MARLLRRQPQVSKLRPPTVVGPPVGTPPIRVRLAEQQRPAQYATRRKPHSQLRPPTVVGAPITFRPILVKLAEQQRPLQYATSRKPHSQLRPPTVVGAPITFRAILAKLADQRNQRRFQHALSRLAPPTVVGSSAPFVSPPRLVRLAASSPLGRRARSLLGKPTVVGPPVVTPPPVVKLTDQRNQRRFQHAVYRLQRPPSILAPPPPTRPVLARLAPSTRLGRRARSFLAPPTVVGAPVVGPPAVRTVLVRQPRAYQRTYYRLAPPTVVGSSAPFVPGGGNGLGWLEPEIIAIISFYG